MKYHETFKMKKIALFLLISISVASCGGDPTPTPAPSTGNVITPTTSNSRIAVNTPGCYKPAYASATASISNGSILACGLVQTSGNSGFDLRMNQEFLIQRSFFNDYVTSAFLFDECGQNANALAHPNGFILFGINMARKLIIENGSELPVAGVLAHEMAHRLQFTNNWINSNEPTVRRSELEADMWSGLYMAIAKGNSGGEIQTFFDALSSFGDYNFNHASHHGTPRQREAAGAVGFEAARLLSLGQIPNNIYSLHNMFNNQVDYITSTVARSERPIQKNNNLDQEWIDGVLDGTRSLEEKGSIKIPKEDRENFFPKY